MANRPYVDDDVRIYGNQARPQRPNYHPHHDTAINEDPGIYEPTYSAWEQERPNEVSTYDRPYINRPDANHPTNYYPDDDYEINRPAQHGTTADYPSYAQDEDMYRGNSKITSTRLRAWITMILRDTQHQHSCLPTFSVTLSRQWWSTEIHDVSFFLEFKIFVYKFIWKRTLLTIRLCVVTFFKMKNYKIHLWYKWKWYSQHSYTNFWCSGKSCTC